MRLVEGHDRISDARPERRAQARVGRLLDRRQPRHPHVARIRAQGRRRGARDADAGRGQRVEGAGRRKCSAANSVITHKPSGRTTTYGKVAEAAAKLEPPKDVTLKDPKDWKIAGKPLKRLDTAGQGHRQAGLRRRSQAARHAQRRDQGMPGLRRQGEELRRRQGHGHAGRQEGGAGRRHRASRSWPTPGGRPRPRSTRCRSSGTRARTPRSRAPSIAEMAQGRPRRRRRPSSATRTATPRPRSPSAAKKVEAVYAYPVPEPRRRWSR